MLKSVVSGFGFYTYFAWVCFFFFSFCHLHCKMIHLIVTLNIQLCTCTFLFPPWNKAISSKWMNFHTLGVLSRDQSADFSWLQPLSVPLSLNGKASLYCPLPLWGDPVLLQGIVLWILFHLSISCCRALLKHLCRHHLSWVTASWAPDEVCRAKLSLEVLCRLCCWDVLGTNHRKHPVHLQERERGQCHHSPATLQRYHQNLKHLCFSYLFIQRLLISSKIA